MEAFDFGYMAGAASEAFGTLIQPGRMMFLILGVLVGLAIGLLPGIGGITGFALLVPFTYTMDPISAFAMLLGMHCVTNTSDTIPSVVLGVPGTSSSQATVLDGFAMTKKGEAGRALSAGFVASLMGGVFGALVLAVSIPVIRPVVLSVGTPELLALTIFGIAMVSSLSGNAPLRGLVAACFGCLVSMIGTDPQSGTMRWAGGNVYLWDGLPLVPVLLGIFALPELCDMVVKRSAVTEKVSYSYTKGMLQGAKDTVRNWWLVVRCSSIGSLMGIIPGISGSVTDWIAYAHALRTEKGASKTFGTGDVRGVIAPESANNAQSGGGLIPTIAFGVPGGAAQAILLGAIMVHGFVPGPSMLTTELDVTYTLIWTIALANIFAAGLCFLMSGQFAKISTLRYTLVLPGIITIAYIGAFQATRSFGDLYTLLLFGVLGWAMKRLRWPRPPLILGLVLGALIERYMGISIFRYDFDWLLRPIVIILLAISALALFRPLWTEIRHVGLKAFLPRGRPSVQPSDLMYVFFLSVAGWMMWEAQPWVFGARVGPMGVGFALLIAGSVSLVYLVFSGRKGGLAIDISHRGIHMDIDSSEQGESALYVLKRGAIFFGWFLLFLALTALIGLIPATPILIVAFMRVEGREPWLLSLTYAVVVTILVIAIFDQLLRLPWPPALIGDLVPALRIIPSV